jgi:NAD(P)H-dependent flavin oxidoreductase YrpB (nitropropane dioxygenase family)
MLASGNARKSWRSTRVARLGIDYPIIQAPFGGLPSQRLAATVSNLGGLLAGSGHTWQFSINEVIAEIRSLTSKPFAINLGRTAQRQRAQRDVAAAGVGRGRSVAEERGGPAATGSTAASGKPGKQLWV